MTNHEVWANIIIIAKILTPLFSFLGGFISGFYSKNIVAKFKTKINIKKAETIKINKTEGGEIVINKTEGGMIVNANIVNFQITSTFKEVKKDE